MGGGTLAMSTSTSELRIHGIEQEGERKESAQLPAVWPEASGCVPE